MLSKLCRAIGIVGMVVAVIVGLVAGNWAVLVAYLAAGFVQFVLFFSIGEVLDRLEQVLSGNAAIFQKLSQQCTTEAQDGKAVQQPMSPQPFIRTSDGSWRCKTCDNLNESTALYCRDCGVYR